MRGGGGGGGLQGCCATVRLVWACRSPQLLGAFKSTWDAAEGCEGFSFRGWADEAKDGEACEAGVPFARGRPDLRAELAALACKGGRKLVFVCHVPAVAALVGELALAHDSVDFHSETFEL